MNKKLLILTSCTVTLVLLIVGLAIAQAPTGSILDIFKSKSVTVPTANQQVSQTQNQTGGIPQCGNQKCERGEYDFNCCRDCGCSAGYLCANNQCAADASKVTLTQVEATAIFQQKYLKEKENLSDKAVFNPAKLTLTMVPTGYTACYDRATDAMKKQGFVDDACLEIHNDKTTGEFFVTL